MADIARPYSNFNTVVRNNSSNERTFGYLSAHGKTLAAGEEHEEKGDLIAKLRANPRHSDMLLDSLQADLDSDVLVIISSPKDHFYDETLDKTVVLQVDNSVVSDVSPTWGDYSSSQLP